MSRHGKQSCSQFEAEKARWDESSVDALVDICVETIQSVIRTPGSPVSKFEWVEVRDKFQTRTGLAFKKEALKNKWDQLRKEWTLWTRMTKNDTGPGWDPLTGRVDMSDDWWQLKIKENKDYAKFRKHGFRYRDQLDFCFAGGVATGKYCVPPKAGNLVPDTQTDEVPLHQTDWFDNDDVYTPVPVDVEALMDDVRSTASSPNKDDFTTPISRRGFTAPVSGNISSPLMPSASQKISSSSRKRKSGSKATEDIATMTRIASALEVHNEISITRLKGRNESASASSPASAAGSAAPGTATVFATPTTEKRDEARAALNELMKAGELSAAQYYFGLELVTEPRYRGIFLDMLPSFRSGYIIMKFESDGQ